MSITTRQDEINNYYAKFNEAGERETSIVAGVHFDTVGQLQPYLDLGFIPISDEEQEMYATNEYIRGADGNPEKKPPHTPTPEEIQKTLTATVQAYLDKKVGERGYDNIFTACTYISSTDETFKAEAIVCVAWRDSVWRICYDILDEVMSGQREIPIVEELLAELPQLNWPEVEDVK